MPETFKKVKRILIRQPIVLPEEVSKQAEETGKAINEIIKNNTVELEGKFPNGDIIKMKIIRKNIPNGEYTTEDLRGLKYNKERIEEEKYKSITPFLYLSKLQYFYRGQERKCKLGLRRENYA